MIDLRPRASQPSSATGKRWERRTPSERPLDDARLPLVLRQLLADRGFRSAEAAEAFLRGALPCEHNPALLPEIEPALVRIAAAIGADELIAIFGDFDVDGVTATAILVEGIAALGGRVIPYLPHRFSEGYGVNAPALSELRRRGVSLVITADCGITAVQEVGWANEIGLEVIVLDHHAVPPELPDALAVIDPKRDGCGYPTIELAACGLAYKLIGALAEHLQRPFAPERYLDLVALGTVCDLVPLLGENRTLVRQGLRALAGSDRPGLRALAEVGRFDLRKPDAETLGFRIGPRLNAAGRLDHAGIAYELLTTRDAVRARELAERLETLNRQRQQATTRAVTLAQTLVAEQGADSPLIMVGHAEFPQGIVGLIASRLVDTHHRPAIVFERGPEHCRGSARSVRQFDITAALRDAAPLMLRFGGHHQAGGFTAENGRIEALTEHLRTYTRERLVSLELGPVLEHDGEIDLDSVGPAELKWLPFLGPFGQGNPEPLFVARRLTVVDRRVIGGDGAHLRLRLRAGSSIWPAIAFNLGPVAPPLGARIDAAAVIRSDRGGAPELQVRDLVVAEA